MTKTNFEKVREFHEAFGLPVLNKPEVTIDRVGLRWTLIEEEAKELHAELFDEDGSILSNPDIYNVAKEASDILYVVYGMMVEFGIDADAVFEEVQSSNMSKLGEDGKPIYRETDGKVLKGPSYRPADIKKVLNV